MGSGGWMKSLQCKSKAADDVVHHKHSHHHHQRSSSCKNSIQNLKDSSRSNNKPPFSRKPDPNIRTWSTKLFPSLTELPEGHPSRNVVEIIFHTSWGDKNFSGQIEMVFKVHNLTRTVTRFEEYRELVKARAGDHARCIADGNEVMRFFCLGGGGGACDGAWGGTSVCMFSGSGVAHEKAGGGRGRKAILVCRVIAGRVGYDSVGKTDHLLLFDSRALLPCFLIIYNL